MGLGFRPGPETHVLDTLAVQIPRCEDLTRTRKDRAYAFEARLSSLDDSTSREPGEEDRALGMACSSPSGVLPVECSVEAIPGLWQTGARKGFVLLAATEEDASIHPGDVVAEVRAGLVETAACECGAVETVFRTEPQTNSCESRGISKLAKHEESCFACAL